MTDFIYKLVRDARISSGSRVHQNNAVACSGKASSSSCNAKMLLLSQLEAPRYAITSDLRKCKNVS